MKNSVWMVILYLVAAIILGMNGLVYGQDVLSSGSSDSQEVGSSFFTSSSSPEAWGGEGDAAAQTYNVVFGASEGFSVAISGPEGVSFNPVDQDSSKPHEEYFTPSGDSLHINLFTDPPEVDVYSSYFNVYLGREGADLKSLKLDNDGNISGAVISDNDKTYSLLHESSGNTKLTAPGGDTIINIPNNYKPQLQTDDLSMFLKDVKGDTDVFVDFDKTSGQVVEIGRYYPDYSIDITREGSQHLKFDDRCRTITSDVEFSPILKFNENFSTYTASVSGGMADTGEVISREVSGGQLKNIAFNTKLSSFDGNPIGELVLTEMDGTTHTISREAVY